MVSPSERPKKTTLAKDKTKEEANATEEHERIHEEEEAPTAPPMKTKDTTITTNARGARDTHTGKLKETEFRRGDQVSPTGTIKLKSLGGYKTHNWSHWDGKTLFTFTRGNVIRPDWHELNYSSFYVYSESETRWVALTDMKYQMGERYRSVGVQFRFMFNYFSQSKLLRYQ